MAGKPIDSGSRARCFAQYMNIHALEATGGFVYSQMGQYEAKPDAPKSELARGRRHERPAVRGHRPQDRPAGPERAGTSGSPRRPCDRAEHELHGDAASLFSLVVGVALILAGVGFLVLALGALAPSGQAATTALKEVTPATGWTRGRSGVVPAGLRKKRSRPSALEWNRRPHAYSAPRECGSRPFRGLTPLRVEHPPMNPPHRIRRSR